MTPPLRRRLRLLRRGAGYAVAGLLVLVAMALGVASQALPLAERHPDRIAAWLSDRAGRPVAFDRVRTEWTRRGPLLRLDNLRVGEGRSAFVIGDTEMLVSLYAGVLPGRPFSELRLRKLDLTLERAADGRWRVRGLPGQTEDAAAGDPLAALEPLGELQVIDGKLAVLAPALGIEARVPRIHLRLRVNGDRVRAGLRAWPQAAGARPLDAVLDFDRRAGDGRLYAGARQADLAAWSSLLRLGGVAATQGRGRAEAWATLVAHRVVEVTVDARLEDVALRGVQGPAAPTPTPFGTVEARVRWRAVRDGWRLDAPRLRVGREDQAQRLDGLLLAGGERFGIRARRIDAGPLLAVAALSDRLPPAVREWIRSTRPQATLADVAVVGRRGGPLRAQATVERLGFRAVNDAPGLDGIAGRVQGDREGLVFEPDPRARVRFDWPSGFGVAHEVTLDGALAAWREGAGWQVATHGLRVRGRGFGAHARGGLRWQGDGSRPRIDLAVRVDDAALPVAKGFWVRQRMSPGALHWLDAAFLGGHVRDGRAVIAGDLDDWPFADRDGLFEATGRIDGGRVRFQADWPATDSLDGHVRFFGRGFDFHGSARLAGIAIPTVHAGIDRYGGGTLAVSAEGGDDAARLLALLRRSPLQKTYGDTLRSLAASGPARATFDLRLPMRPQARARIGGEVRLDGARLADTRWKLAFDQVRGRIVYRADGVLADALQVRREGQPGRLALRIGDYVREPRNAVEVELDATLSARDLLDRAPELAWLKPHVDGRSPWTVGIAVPRTASGRAAPTLLHLRSNLVGTALDLPAPLRKLAAAALPTTVETPWPLGNGEVRVAFGNLLALRARNAAGRTGVRVQLGAARVDEAPPAAGLAVAGRTPRLDAVEWLTLTRGGEGTGEGLALQRIDVVAERLHLLGGVFPDTRLLATPAAGGATAVRASGPALAGNVLVPAGDGAISGRFERVHWKAAGGAVASGTRSAAGDAGAVDPARIPPLAFDIDELRLNEQPLGVAQLRTRPMPAGLRLERLHADRGRQSLLLTGEWTGRGAGARTRLDAEVESDDFGRLLAAFGYGGRIDGGRGRLEFDAQWPGSPAAFALAGLEGGLTLEVRDGRLLEVEPGAGRVLGLLSLAQLPRRLMLDFRDFFAKGFAFNRMGGTVRFGDGLARSEDLAIDGPAAAIGIRGAADLRSQTFDQTIEVRPKTGNLLTVAGALAGGPMGAAIGAAANAVLQKPLGGIGAKTYRVTGPWKEPKVEVLGREQGRAAARERDTAG